MLLLLQSSGMGISWFDIQLFERLFMELDQVSKNKDCWISIIIGSFHLNDVSG